MRVVLAVHDVNSDAPVSGRPSMSSGLRPTQGLFLYGLLWTSRASPRIVYQQLGYHVSDLDHWDVLQLTEQTLQLVSRCPFFVSQLLASMI